jgi:hypothetical protein
MSGSMLKQGLSIGTTFYPPKFSLDSNFKGALRKKTTFKAVRPHPPWI